jgi:diguanylate cyclase (GGDEF)-like protein/PAS domain S-box-containing protein
MAEEKNFYKDIIDNLYDGVYFVDRDRVITYWNKGAERITGYSAARTLGRACRDNLLNHVTASGVELCANNCPLAAVMKDGKEREVEVYLHHSDGYRVPVLIRAAALRDEEGQIIGAIETFSKNALLADTRRRLKEMRRVAMTDPLTGVSNRRHIESRLKTAIAVVQNSSSLAGVLFMDVDYFKKVNDTHGHITGDHVLRMVANTAQYALRATDTLGRWGGEEFVAILYELQNGDNLGAIAEKVRTLVEASRLDVNGQGLTVTISIGATLVLPGDTLEVLVQRADAFMYRSKQAGRNRVTLG